MAAACRCPYGQRAHFPAFTTHNDPDPVPNDMCVIPGLPDLLPPMGLAGCLYSCIYNPLHAARRAMAAACRCLRGNGGFSYMTNSCPKPLWVILRQPNLLPPNPARQRKRKVPPCCGWGRVVVGSAAADHRCEPCRLIVASSRCEPSLGPVVVVVIIDIVVLICFRGVLGMGSQ